MTYIPDKLRQLVFKRADLRCEYCHLHQNNTLFTHEIDHIYAEKHGGATEEANLCLACNVCNRYKGSNLCSLDPVTGAVVALYHPRREMWAEHFILQVDGRIEPLSEQGRVTAKVLRFNLPELIIARADWIKLDIY